MPQFNWQDSFAILLVAIAGTYLTWRLIAVVIRRRSAGCSAACAQCPSTQHETGEKGAHVSVITPQQLANTLPKARASVR